MRISRSIGGVAAIGLMACVALAQGDPDKGKLKRFAVEEVVNDRASFKIKVAADHADGVYREGEALALKLLAERDCYIYLLNYDSEGTVSCLFPNDRQPDNFIKGGVEVQFPAKDKGYQITARAPFGEDLIQVIATLQPLEAFKGKALTKARATPLKPEELRAAVKRIKGFKVEDAAPAPGPGPNSEIWAEGKFKLKTVARQAQATQDK